MTSRDAPLRLLTWNLQAPHRSRARDAQQATLLAEAAADVMVLTEAYPGAVPREWASVNSATIPGVGTDIFTSVTAPAIEAIPLHGVPTAAAGLVEHANQRVLVVGVCMPWRLNAPPLPPETAPDASTGPEQWFAVLERLGSALEQARNSHQPDALVLAGDFNQNLSGRHTGFAGGREALTRLLDRFDLVAWSAPLPSRFPDYGTVDHICSAGAAEVRVEPVPGSDRFSDHLAYIAHVS